MDLGGLHVIVAGGGVGGAVAALVLASGGARVTLCEKVAEIRAVGAGIGLQANGLAVLEALGLGAGIARFGVPVVAGKLVTATGRTILEPPPSRIVMMRRSDLAAILGDALAAQPRVTARYGAEVTAARRDGTVELRGETLHADLVVGADGVRSRVRDGGAFGVKMAEPGISYLRALVGPGLARSEEAWTSAGIFGSFPVTNGTYLYASCGTRALRAAVTARDLEALRATWIAAYPPAQDLLAGLVRFDELLVNEVIRVRCKTYVDGKVALLGDAAHAMAPNLGQGANSAMVDAVVLLDELRRAAALPAALSAYDARRRPAVDKVQSLAARLGSISERTGTLTRFVRDRLVMPIAGRLATRTTATVMQESPEALAALLK